MKAPTIEDTKVLNRLIEASKPAVKLRFYPIMACCELIGYRDQFGKGYDKQYRPAPILNYKN